MAKSFWHHADDRARCAIDHYRAAEHVRPCVQCIAPEIVANDCDRSRARATFFVGEGAATRRRQTEHIEEIPSNLRRRDRFRRRAVIYSNYCGAARATRDIFENVAPELTEARDSAVGQIHRRSARTHFIRRFVNPNKLLRVRKWKGTQQDSLDYRKNRRVRTDAKGQRQDRDGGKARRFQQKPQSIFEIAEHKSLLGAKCLNRIHHCRAARRQETGEQRGGREQNRCAAEQGRIMR